jgi:CMP-N-acetylneuraminic acid synthetase
MEIIRQAPLSENQQREPIQIFGKSFALTPVSEKCRFIYHEDFPLIQVDDIKAFILYSSGKNKIVISGCTAEVHPYRLMLIEESGFDRNLADIPQDIRGSRHVYPEVYQFSPALIYIPPYIPTAAVHDPDRLDMYIMPSEKLLDQSSLMDRLLISAYLKSTSSAFNLCNGKIS